MLKFTRFVVIFFLIVSLGAVTQAKPRRGHGKPKHAQAPALSEQLINRTIKRMQNYLFSQQQPNGGFDQGPGYTTPTVKNYGGETALVVLALLRSGANPQDPRLAKALDYLGKIKLIGTYPTGISAEAWAELPDRYLPRLKDDAIWLLKAAKNHDGVFHYTLHDGGMDHSTTQYGVLGLWSYDRRGGNTPKSFWKKILAHFLSAQNIDGGWSYGLHGKSTGSMTAAGLTVEYIAQEQLYRDSSTPKQVQDSIHRGLKWLDENFTAAKNPGEGNRFPYYYLYGVERVGLASGVKYFGGHDWFREGAEQIIRNTYKPGSSKAGSIRGNIYQTAFGLIFLSRGHVPVWASKLRVNGKNWNHNPNDLYFLTQYLSNVREHHLNWQVISADAPPQRWLNAPLAYLSIDGPVQLTDEQKQHLKAYIDRGGMLFASPAGNSAVFSTSVIKLMKELYPKYEFKPMSGDDPIANIIYKLGGTGRIPVLVLNNGARDLVCLSQENFGYPFQSEKNRQSLPWKFAINLYVAVTDHGQVTNRLDTMFPGPLKDAPGSHVTLGRLKYDGNWDPEPATFIALDRLLARRSGIGVKTQNVSFSDLAKCKLPLVVIEGTKSVNFTGSQIKDIVAYTKGGGRVFVETVGGRGSFASKLGDQLGQALKTSPERIDITSPIITGQGLKGGADCSSVDYRRYTVIQAGAQHEPRLLTINVHKKPAIILSSEDLDEGVLGVRQWGINGYYRGSARQLWINLILDAKNGFHG